MSTRSPELMFLIAKTSMCVFKKNYLLYIGCFNVIKMLDTSIFKLVISVSLNFPKDTYSTPLSKFLFAVFYTHWFKMNKKYSIHVNPIVL